MPYSEFPKEIAWRIAIHPERVSTINEWKTPQERIRLLNQVLLGLNITKWELHEVENEIWVEWTLRVNYLIQSLLGTPLWLCDWFRIFHSRKNRKYHSICLMTADKTRAKCSWIVGRCHLWFFGKDWKNIKPPEREWRKIKFNKL